MKLWRFMPLIALCAASANATVPLSYAASGHPTVPTLVEGKGPFEFVIDTGAEGTALYSAFARQQGLKLIEGKAETLQGQTGAASLSLARVSTLSVDGRTVKDVEAVILPDRADGVALPGIVGLDLLGSYVVELDVPGGRVALHPPGTSARTLGGDGIKGTKAVKLAGGLLGLPIVINGVLGVAVLDTGARDTRINWRFATAAGLSAASAGLKSDGIIQGATNSPVAVARADIGTIDLGGIRRTGVSLRIVDLPVFEAFGVADRPAMILGMDLLRDVHLIADFPAQMVWMAQRPARRPEQE
jgi:predicted aspartyl protease